MKQNYLKIRGPQRLSVLCGFAALMASPLMFTSCVDDNYDFDDIDTTTRVQINDLTVPLKLKSVLLDEVLDLSDNENISEVTVDGKKIYAIEKSGTFTSNKVSINPVHVNAPALNPTSISLNANVPGNAPAKMKAPSLDDLKVDYDVDSEMLSNFSFESAGIDDALISVKSITSSHPIALGIRFSIPSSLAANVGKVQFSNVKLQLAKGFYKNGVPATTNVGTYDPVSGNVMINHVFDLNGSNYIDITLEATEINAEVAGIAIADNEIDYRSKAGLLPGGTISLIPSFDHITLPSSFDLSADYTLTSFDVKTFSGQVKYTIEGINIDPIDLSNLPDFLSDPSTDIRLVNPQVYLGAVNTTAPYHTGVKGSLSLTSHFEGGEVNECVSPEFSIGYDRGPIQYNIALAADPSNLNLSSEFTDATPYTFNGLGNILSNPVGAGGLPKTVNVSLDNLVFEGEAVNFPIRQNDGSDFGEIPEATGKYTFFAPLAFENGSTIIYHKTEDELSSDDLNKVTVNKVKLSAQAHTNIPLSVSIDLAVYNTSGKQVGKCTRSITLEPNSNRPIELIVESTPDSPIKDIDSVEYRARILATGDQQALSPDQYIRLDDIRVTVDGYYETDF